MSVVRPKLWEPPAERRETSAMMRFLRLVEARHGVRLPDYESLWRWSTAHPALFWGECWDFVGIRAETRGSVVVDDPDRMPGARFFPGARLSFAENLLRDADDTLAISAYDERGERSRLTRRQLHDAVGSLAAALHRRGVGPGDRVAAQLPNGAEAIIAMLAAARLGATWSSCSPDFGLQGVLDRFGQIAPKVLFTTDGYLYAGKRFDVAARTAEVVRRLPGIEQVVLVRTLADAQAAEALPQACAWDELMAEGAALPAAPAPRFPFDHPLYVMYSSGTTGLPKCLVQGGGGVLLNQLKEHVLHVDLCPGDAIFYFTTTGWMMWNWLAAALGAGARLVLYDGSPTWPGPEALWNLAERERLAVFGASARYLAALEKDGYKPAGHHDLGPLRTILSTGSPLSPESFRYVYRSVKSDVQLASISGGTDLNGCFVLGNPLDAVHEGEIQCRGLGMSVAAFDDAGRPVVGRTGELVCTRAFPSMPLGFWNDPEGARYRAAYFERFPGAWHHGDFVEITDHGAVVITGRSDATLNPGGVRLGTADLYRVVETFPEVRDSLAVAQDWQGDVRVILFLKLAPGVTLTENLRARLAARLRETASPRHVPARMIAVPDIPYTLSGKKVELAVRNVIHGKPVTNRDALANPECLEAFANLPELQT